MKALLGFIVVVLSVLVVAYSSEASFSLELENKVVDGDVVSNVNINPVHAISKKVQVFAFSLTGENWAQAYGGLLYSLKPWLTVGAAAGMETADSPWRIAASLWIGKGPVSLLCLYENGGSGYWYSVSPTVQIKKWLTVGILAKRFAGVGPLVRVSIPKTPIQIWAVPAYDFEFEQQKTLIGISIGL